MNKKIKIIIPILIILLFCGIFSLSQHIQKGKNTTHSTPEPFSYEILDDGVIQDDTMKSWVNDNLSNEGIYDKTFNGNTYILISAGSENKKGHGIGLLSLEDKKDSVEINYEIVDIETNENLDRIPHMIIRINSERKVTNISEIKN